MFKNEIPYHTTWSSIPTNKEFKVAKPLISNRNCRTVLREFTEEVVNGLYSFAFELVPVDTWCTGQVYSSRHKRSADV